MQAEGEVYHVKLNLKCLNFPGSPGNLQGDDGLTDVEPPLDTAEDVNQEQITGQGDVTLFPGQSQLSESHSLGQETELYETDPTYFGESLASSYTDGSQTDLFEESQHATASSALENISANESSPPPSFYSRQLDSSSPVQNLPAVDPSAILSPEHAGRGYPPFPVLQPVKRGPGRPRKDGQSPIPRKRRFVLMMHVCSPTIMTVHSIHLDMLSRFNSRNYCMMPIDSDFITCNDILNKS